MPQGKKIKDKIEKKQLPQTELLTDLTIQLNDFEKITAINRLHVKN